jgi:hypothetical protein
MRLRHQQRPSFTPTVSSSDSSLPRFETAQPLPQPKRIRQSHPLLQLSMSGRTGTIVRDSKGQPRHGSARSTNGTPPLTPVSSPMATTRHMVAVGQLYPVITEISDWDQAPTLHATQGNAPLHEMLKEGDKELLLTPTRCDDCLRDQSPLAASSATSPWEINHSWASCALQTPTFSFSCTSDDEDSLEETLPAKPNLVPRLPFRSQSQSRPSSDQQQQHHFRHHSRAYSEGASIVLQDARCGSFDCEPEPCSSRFDDLYVLTRLVRFCSCV